MKNKLTLLLLVIVAFSCRGKTNFHDYLAYLNDPRHKITQQIKVGNIQVTLKLIPEFLQNISFQSYSDIPKGNNSYYLFDIRFDKVNGEKPSKEKLLYMDFDLQKDFAMQIGRYTLFPAICQKIENGIPGSYQYLIAFPKGGRSEKDFDFGLLYEDKVFGVGTIAFLYKKDDIKKIPVIKSSVN